MKHTFLFFHTGNNKYSYQPVWYARGRKDNNNNQPVKKRKKYASRGDN